MEFVKSNDISLVQPITIVDMKDVQGPKKLEVLQAIRKACEEDGLFYVINHDLSEHIMKNTLKVAEEFFKIPQECRRELYSEDPSKPVRVNAIQDDEIKSRREYLRLECHSKDAWPSTPTTFKEVVGSYGAEMEELTVKILALISGSLGLEEDRLMKKLGGEVDQQMYMSKTRHDSAINPLPLRAHCDPTVVTLTHLDYHLPGLQFMRDDNIWVTLSPVENSVIVNLGDQIEVLTNGVYKSCVHRAVVDTRITKTISIPTLCFPHLSAVVEPLEELVTEGNPRKYRSFTYQEYFDVFWKSSPTIYRSDILAPFML